MADQMMTALQQLLQTSLTQWQLDPAVEAAADAIKVSKETTTLTISRAPNGMPFRWVVDRNGRRRTAASVNGVLRIVRQTLAPGYAPLSLRIAPLPGTPSRLQDAP